MCDVSINSFPALNITRSHFQIKINKIEISTRFRCRTIHCFRRFSLHARIAIVPAVDVTSHIIIRVECLPAYGIQLRISTFHYIVRHNINRKICSLLRAHTHTIHIILNNEENMAITFYIATATAAAAAASTHSCNAKNKLFFTENVIIENSSPISVRMTHVLPRCECKGENNRVDIHSRHFHNLRTQSSEQ